MTRYLYGLHEPGGEDVVGLPAGSHIVFTHETGHDPSHRGGFDYRPWGKYLCIARLNNGYGASGTIPLPEHYDQFAVRLANWVANSQGCRHWIIGNEPNHSQERPNGKVITAADYVRCFNLCETTIHAVQPDAVVMPAAIAPWNIESGDWLKYFDAVIAGCRGVGAIALHTYTHGSDPALVTSNEKMASHPDRFYHFRAYRDFLNRVPDDMLDLPVYITETDQDVAWLDENSGWVREAYAEIDDWNHFERPTIHGLTLYRWPRYDKWYIDGKQGVIADMKAAIAQGYTVPEDEVMQWKRVYYNDCEQYWDQGGEPELTIPVGSAVHYRHTNQSGNFPRPEMDHKKTSDGQSEVHNPPGASATGFYISSTGQFAWVFDKISVTPGDKLRARCAYMHIAREGGQKGACGGRIGLILGDDTPFDTSQREWPKDGFNPFTDQSITWGEWVTSRPGSPDYLTDRTWTTLTTGEVQHGVSHVRAIVFFTSDNTQTVHGFVDDVEIEAYTDQTIPPPEPPPSGSCDLKQLYMAMAEEAEIMAEAYEQVAELWREMI